MGRYQGALTWPSIPLFIVLCALGRVRAFTFSFTTPATQCGNTTVQWSDGRPPYSLLLLPIGHLSPETRTIIQQDITDGGDVSFVLDYPSQSQFVAIMNDTSGIGAGGTSNVMTVGTSSDASCLNTQQVSPKLDFFQSPTNVTQCGNVNLSWQSAAGDPVDILAVIPGGDSFLIANITNGSTSVDWQADLRAGTEVLFVAGDQSGLGTGGSTNVMTVGEGDSSCLNGSPPTSDAPSAGGTVTIGVTAPTTIPSGSGGPPMSDSSGKSRHIVGLIIGLVLGITLVVLCAGGLFIFTRRRGRARRSDAYHDIDSGAARPRPLSFPRRALLALQSKLSSTFFWRKDNLRRGMYQAEPFVVPASTSSFGTFASSGVLESPPLAHSIYRHSTKHGLGIAHEDLIRDQPEMVARGSAVEQLDYRALVPSDVSSETLAERDELFFRRGLGRAQTVRDKGFPVNTPAGLRLVTQDPDAVNDTEIGSENSGTTLTEHDTSI